MGWLDQINSIFSLASTRIQQDQVNRGLPVSDNTDYGFGLREDGTNKGLGFYGKVPSQSGERYSTEVSEEMDGVFYPLIHEGSTPSQIQMLANGLAPTRQMSLDAYDQAIRRMSQGKSPFAQPGEQRIPRLQDMQEYNRINRGTQ